MKKKNNIEILFISIVIILILTITLISGFFYFKLIIDSPGLESNVVFENYENDSYDINASFEEISLIREDIGEAGIE